MTWLCCRVSGLEEEEGKYGFCRVFQEKPTSYMEMKGRVVGNEQNKTQQGLVKFVHRTAGSSGLVWGVHLFKQTFKCFGRSGRFGE